jgi:hypothetical protein
MSLVFLRPVVAFISIIVGLGCLGVCIFRRQWFVEGGLLRKKYSGDDGRVFYAMIGTFFILGGLAFLLTR